MKAYKHNKDETTVSNIAIILFDKITKKALQFDQILLTTKNKKWYNITN